MSLVLNGCLTTYLTAFSSVLTFSGEKKTSENINMFIIRLFQERDKPASYFETSCGSRIRYSTDMGNSRDLKETMLFETL